VKPWEVLARAQTSDGGELTLTRHVSQFVILANGQTLMTSRMHASEDALAVLGCKDARTMANPSVLVGGLGMGYTLRTALDILPSTANVLVAELVPAVVEWNRGPLGPLANHPLDDPRVGVEERDVVVTMRSSTSRFDAVLLDVDNGSSALVIPSNDSLYSDHGIAAARRSLTPGGVLAVWSASDDDGFERRLRAGGFSVQRERVRSRLKNRGSRHTILVAHKRA
jgi:spermidine synthase